MTRVPSLPTTVMQKKGNEQGTQLLFLTPGATLLFLVLFWSWTLTAFLPALPPSIHLGLDAYFQYFGTGWKVGGKSSQMITCPCSASIHLGTQDVCQCLDQGEKGRWEAIDHFLLQSTVWHSTSVKKPSQITGVTLQTAINVFNWSPEFLTGSCV